MIYPTYCCKFDTQEEKMEIIINLQQCFIQYCPTRTSKYLYVDGETQTLNDGLPSRFAKPMDYNSFIQKYIDFKNTIYKYVNSLKPGDTVTIEPRRKDGHDYPYFYSDPMAEKAGSVFEIGAIRRDSDYNYHVRAFHNGTALLFTLKNSCYKWHSSMFVLPSSEIKPVARIEIVDLNLDSIIL